jgi:hypothetical protein
MSEVCLSGKTTLETKTNDIAIRVISENRTTDSDSFPTNVELFTHFPMSASFIVLAVLPSFSSLSQQYNLHRSGFYYLSINMLGSVFI